MVAKCIPVQPFRFFAAFEISKQDSTEPAMCAMAYFPDDSYGRSVTNIFKTGPSRPASLYKINGRNYIYANVADITRRRILTMLTFRRAQEILSSRHLVASPFNLPEAGIHILNAQKIKLRIGGYYTAQKRRT